MEPTAARKAPDAPRLSADSAPTRRAHLTTPAYHTDFRLMDRRLATQAGDLILEQQFAALEFGNPERVGSGVMQFTFYCRLKSGVTTLKLFEVRLDGHEFRLPVCNEGQSVMEAAKSRPGNFGLFPACGAVRLAAWGDGAVFEMEQLGPQRIWHDQ